MERMVPETVGTELDTPSFKQHNGDVNVPFPGSRYPLPQPFEVGFIKLGKIKFGFAIQGISGPCPFPGMGLHVKDFWDFLKISARIPVD
jgi:hypothetical protein